MFSLLSCQFSKVSLPFGKCYTWCCLNFSFNFTYSIINYSDEIRTKKHENISLRQFKIHHPNWLIMDGVFLGVKNKIPPKIWYAIFLQNFHVTTSLNFHLTILQVTIGIHVRKAHLISHLEFSNCHAMSDSSITI